MPKMYEFVLYPRQQIENIWAPKKIAPTIFIATPKLYPYEHAKIEGKDYMHNLDLLMTLH